MKKTVVRRPKPKSGDIFAFEFDAERFGIGQIIDEGLQLYITILRQPVTAPILLDELNVSDILLCGRTTDARLYHGMWKVIGSLPLPANVPRPCSKVNVGDERWIKNFQGDRIRLATDEEWERLDYQTSRSPIAYEDSFKALHGLASALPGDHKMHIDHLNAQVGICMQG